jgi:transposase
MSEKLNTTVAVIGIDIGKNSFHVIGLDARGAIALRARFTKFRHEFSCVSVSMPVTSL